MRCSRDLRGTRDSPSTASTSVAACGRGRGAGPWPWRRSKLASGSVGTSRSRTPTRTTRWSGSSARPASRTGRTVPTPSSSPTSSSRSRGRRTPRTSSPRSTSGARSARPSGSRRCARSSTGSPTRSPAWGVRDGYFVDDEEADAFSAELKHVLVTQRAAFNSPVWFNIGVKNTPQQASACQPYDALVEHPGGTRTDRQAGRGRRGWRQGLRCQRADEDRRHEGEWTQAGTAGAHHVPASSLDVTSDHLVWRSAARQRERVRAGWRHCCRVTSSSGTGLIRGAPARSRRTRSLRRLWPVGSSPMASSASTKARIAR